METTRNCVDDGYATTAKKKQLADGATRVRQKLRRAGNARESERGRGNGLATAAPRHTTNKGLKRLYGGLDVGGGGPGSSRGRLLKRVNEDEKGTKSNRGCFLFSFESWEAGGRRGRLRMNEGEGEGEGHARVRRAAVPKAREDRHAGRHMQQPEVGEEGNIQGLPPRLLSYPRCLATSSSHATSRHDQSSCKARSSYHIEKRGRDPSIRPQVPAGRLPAACFKSRRHNDGKDTGGDEAVGCSKAWFFRGQR